MATRLQYSFLSSIMKFLLYSSLLLLFSFSYFPEKIEALETQFHTVDITPYLSPASVCSRASTTGSKNRASKLEVVDKHGPCTQNQTVSLPSLAEVLANDQLRVESIQARVIDSTDTNKKIDKSQNPNKFMDTKAKLPAYSGALLDGGNYIVKIALGTPERILSLMFDTGSDLTWTQCKPCAGQCYNQSDPIFNPFGSSTYSNISCDSTECSQLNSIHKTDCYLDVTCIYSVRYGDNSYSVGIFGRDKLILTPTDVFPDFLFGCGQNNKGLFGKTAGLLGLSKGSISFLSQTAKKYGHHFSYCLPSDISSTGFLVFGNNNNNNHTRKDDAMIFTPLVPAPPGVPPIFYFIVISAISVGGIQLRISELVFQTPTIIDSGTVITRLPPTAYNAMSQEFKKQMKAFNYTSAPPYEDFLDTCFYINANITNIPTMSFTFMGNKTVDLDPSGIIVALNSSVACLAFAHNQDVAIFGNTQQKKLEVVYDVAGGNLGFAHNPQCQ